MGIGFEEEYSGNGTQDELDGEEPRSQGGGEEAGVADQLPPLPKHWRGAWWQRGALGYNCV